METNNLKEALALSELILSQIELSSASLSTLALKSARLARLMGNFEFQQIMLFEASGYPTTPDGIEKPIWRLLQTAKRTYKVKDSETEEVTEKSNISSIEQLEIEIQSYQEGIRSAQDANVSLASANPTQWVREPQGNAKERARLLRLISERTKIIAERRGFIYDYAVSVYYDLKFSEVAKDIFSRIRNRVDAKVGELVPDSIKKFSAVYENLESENDEDWSNAVHSCRRILQDTADTLYPAREDKTIDVSGKPKVIKLGPDAYINRIMAFVEENSTSERFNAIVGSHLRFLGERLDSIFQAAQKGSHHVISTQDEADRYVIYTYLVVGDLLQLKGITETQPIKS